MDDIIIALEKVYGETPAVLVLAVRFFMKFQNRM